MLLFLDFDGVLHACSGQTPFQPRCLEALASSLEKLPIEIVIASTWRENMAIEELRLKLSVLDKPVVGITPILDEPFVKHVRFHEVLMYLAQTNQSSRPWFAIDDTHGFFPNTAPVYWTDPLTGFTKNDVQPLRLFIDKLVL